MYVCGRDFNLKVSASFALKIPQFVQKIEKGLYAMHTLYISTILLYDIEALNGRYLDRHQFYYPKV